MLSFDMVLKYIFSGKKFGFRPESLKKNHFRKVIFNVMNRYIFYPEMGLSQEFTDFQ